MRLVIGTIAVLCLAAPAPAAEQPLWELGAGIGVVNLPRYRGSDEQRTFFLPIPFFVYNGEQFKVDRAGAHGDLARTDNVVLDLSLGIEAPVTSGDNGARAGMANLDPTLELGPSLRWRWFENAQHNWSVSLHLPLRAVVATNLTRFQDAGWIFSPNLALNVLNLGSDGWNFSAAAGPLYASEKYHDYYYRVGPEFATATRPAYDTRAGYSGDRVTLTLAKRYRRFWAGGFVRYDSLHHAVIEDSPLVRSKNSLIAGVGISWIFAHSETLVPVTSLRTAP